MTQLGWLERKTLTQTNKNLFSLPTYRQTEFSLFLFTYVSYYISCLPTNRPCTDTQSTSYLQKTTEVYCEKKDKKWRHE